jgi:hypothetical protein
MGQRGLSAVDPWADATPAKACSAAARVAGSVGLDRALTDQRVLGPVAGSSPRIPNRSSLHGDQTADAVDQGIGDQLHALVDQQVPVDLEHQQLLGRGHDPVEHPPGMPTAARPMYRHRLLRLASTAAMIVVTPHASQRTISMAATS